MWGENALGGCGGRRPGFEGAMAQRSEAVGGRSWSGGGRETLGAQSARARMQLAQPQIHRRAKAVSGFQAIFGPSANCTADCSAVHEINNFICLARAPSNVLSVRRWPIGALSAAVQSPPPALANSRDSGNKSATQPWRDGNPEPDSCHPRGPRGAI